MKPLITLLVLLPTVVLAQAAASVVPATYAPPQWVQDVMNFVLNIPKVGPVLTTAILWLSVVGTTMTAMATAVMAICKSLSRVLDAAKFTALSDKVDALYQKIAPYIQWLSLYNAKIPPKQ